MNNTFPPISKELEKGWTKEDQSPERVAIMSSAMWAEYYCGNKQYEEAKPYVEKLRLLLNKASQIVQKECGNGVRVNMLERKESEVEIVEAFLPEYNDIFYHTPARMFDKDSDAWTSTPCDKKDMAILCITDSNRCMHRVTTNVMCVHPYRPMLYIHSAPEDVGRVFEFGGREFEIVSENYAFCTTDIGKGVYAYPNNGEPKVFDYDSSIAKVVIDMWFKRAMRGDDLSHFRMN